MQRFPLNIPISNLYSHAPQSSHLYLELQFVSHTLMYF